MTKILLALQLYSVREKCKVLTINQTSTYQKKKKKIKLPTYDVAKLDSGWQPQEYIQLRREREREICNSILQPEAWQDQLQA